MSDERLDTPYREGPAIPSDGNASVLSVSLDGKGYLVDTSRSAPGGEKFRRQSVQLLNTQQNIDKGESGLTPPEVWRRTYQSWHHGMGQKMADRADSDPYRYDWSRGINVWEKWQISLLNDTVKHGNHSYLYGMLVDGKSVGVTSSGVIIADSAGETNVTIQDSLTNPVYASGGKYLFQVGFKPTSTEVILRRYTISGSGTSITVNKEGDDATLGTLGFVPSLLVFANFKLFVATTDGKLWDITKYINGTTDTLTKAVITPPFPGFRWVGGCSGKRSTYMMGVQGDKTTIHAITLDDTIPDLAVDGGVVAELPDGEIGTAIYSYLGYVAIGTSRGFRFAAMTDSGGGLTYGPLIETPMSVRCFEGQGRFLYYGLSGFDGRAGIGKADLSEFVTDLQPAYASDLMTSVPANGETTFINTLPDGKIIFGLSSGGSWLQAPTYVDEGVIILSAWTFNVVDQKTGLYVMTQNSVLSGGSGRFDISCDGMPFVTIGTASSSQSASERYPLVDVTFHKAALRITIASDSSHTSSPHVDGVEMRATYVRGAASEWQVPCILHDEIEMDNGTVSGRDVIADFDHLIGLVQTGRQFAYIEDGRTWGVYATDFIWSPHERSAHKGWQGVFTIYFREVR